MLIKLLIIIILAYLGYRLVVGPPLLGERKTKHIPKKEDEVEDTDYEDLV